MREQSAVSTPRWLWLHFGAHKRFKIVGIAIFMTLFFTAYILLLKAPQFPVTQMPVTAVDRAVGFAPWTLMFYVLLWPYVSLAPCFLLDKRQLVDYLGAALLLSLVGMACYLFWPTASPPPPTLKRDGPGYGLLLSVDAAGNAFPSLHVAFAVFTAAWFDPLLKHLRAGTGLRVSHLLLCAAVCLSTLTTKQHVAVDVYGGLLLGLPIGWALRRRLNLDAFYRSSS